MVENLIHIGEVVVHGIMFDPKNGEALRTMDFAALYKSVPLLFELLDQRGVNCVLVGGIAMLASDVDDVRKIVSEIEDRIARQPQRLSKPQRLSGRPGPL